MDTNGVQWPELRRRVYQPKEAIHTLKTNPDSRRIIISAWNVANIHMNLPCPTSFFQFYVANNRLSIPSCQQSATFSRCTFLLFLYALLLQIRKPLKSQVLQAEILVHTLGQMHIFISIIGPS